MDSRKNQKNFLDEKFFSYRITTPKGENVFAIIGARRVNFYCPKAKDKENTKESLISKNLRLPKKIRIVTLKFFFDAFFPAY